MFETGNIYRNAGNPIAGNGADTSLDILDGFTLPANAFDVAGRQLNIQANGKFGATVSGNVVLTIYANPTYGTAPTKSGGKITGGTVSSGTVLATVSISSGSLTGNTGWSLSAILQKYGAAGSNTQYAQGQSINNTTHNGISAPTFPALAENAAIDIVVCASSSNSTANEVVLNYTEATWLN